MKKMLVVMLSLGLVACVETPPASPDKSSAGQTPAQWQQFKSKKGIDELDANTK